MSRKSLVSNHLLARELRSGNQFSFVDDRGATAVEYGMLVALIAAVVVGTITLLGPIVNGLYEAVQWW